MKVRSYIFLFLALCLLTGCSRVPPGELENAARTGTLPSIDPDYTDIVLPVNIAPVNFTILRPGTDHVVRIHGKEGQAITIRSVSGVVRIPENKWKNLLKTNQDDTLIMDIWIKRNDVWKRCAPIKNIISPDAVDPWLTYRLINPAYNLWGEMGLYQRHVESFRETPILINRAVDGSCMNCHHPSLDKPGNALFHIRAGKASGTFIMADNKPVKVNTATDFNRAGAYASWHPLGDRIAFSVNTLAIFFHVIGECRDVIDHKSDLIVYNIPRNEVTTCPGISSPDRLETFPCWSGDGRSLYFASSPPIEKYFVDTDGRQDLTYDQILYDLNRIPYNPDTGSWGETETLLSGEEAGFSAVQPRVSPDGQWLLFTACDYGSFPIYLKSSDLMMLNLGTGALDSLDQVNSDETESHHAWSSNSRWFVFSSKRRNGLLARPYFCHIDANGNISKPFVLPQKDPQFYDQFLKTYNVPEFARVPEQVSPQKIREIMNDNSRRKNAALDPGVGAPVPEKQTDKPYTTAPG
ncbi:PD40 domain-containing protein [bacterium]|nr:PD40 domain-containing protein [bacterium]